MTAAQVPASGMEGLVDSLAGETEECNFLSALCLAAQRSIDRAEGTPSGADVLATHQSLTADTRVREAVDAADLIERKRGRRLACFDTEPCTGIVPKPRLQPAPKRRRDPPA